MADQSHKNRPSGRWFHGIRIGVHVCADGDANAFLMVAISPGRLCVGRKLCNGLFLVRVLHQLGAQELILKHGGIRAHRRAIPLFFGLILGDYIVGSLWSVVGIILHREVYTIFI